MIDTVIGERFRITERLVRQGVVEIFEGTDLVEGHPVWIKWWENSPITQELDFIENWHGQLVSVQGIDDGHLPRLLAFGRTPQGDMYQVEEPPHGATLRRYAAKRAPLAVGEAVGLVAAAARAVGVAHREGVAHGGLSPETIYIEEEADGRPEAFITSWEAGELVVGLRNTGEALPDRLARYLSPEQLSEVVPPATPPSDVYSLAAILYELLTGSLPQVSQGATPPSRFNPEVSAPIEQVLLRALSRDPASRQPNAQSFASALMQALTVPEPAAPPPPPPLIERQETIVLRRRPPIWQAVGAFLALLLICLLATIAWQLREPQPTVALASLDATATALAQTVPNLIGPPPMRYNEAVQLAWNRGFVVSIAAFVEDDTLPAGVVVRQCPAPGSMRGASTLCQGPGLPPVTDDTILVEVSALPEAIVMRVVPDLYGQPENQARAALESGGLRLGIRREAYDLLIPTGAVVEQNPRRGLAVLPGTAVDVIVSAGLPPASGAGVPAPSPQPNVPVPQATATLAMLPSPTVASEPFPPPPPITLTPDLLPTPTLPSDPSGAALLSDDFEQGNLLGWTEEQGEAQVGQIRDGVFSLQINEPGLFWKTRPSNVFTDFTYQATILLDPVTQDFESGAGIVFRVQDDQSFYYFEVNNSNQFRLRARSGEKWVLLTEGEGSEWRSDPAVRSAGSPNTLQVQAVGERLILFINDIQVAAIDTPPEVTYLSGDIGLGGQAGTFPLFTFFDDVLVTP